jgi:hypothetical protein
MFETYQEAAQEAVWMKEFISELGVVPSAVYEPARGRAQ